MSKSLQGSNLAQVRQMSMERLGLGEFQCKNDGTITYIDSVTIDILNLADTYPKPEMAIGKNISDLVFSAEDKQVVINQIQEHGHYYCDSYYFKTLTGKDRWCIKNAYQVIHDEPSDTRIHITIKDITKQKTTEDTLLYKEGKLNATLAAIGDAVIVTDTTGKIIRLNPIAEDLTGWPSGEAIGQPLDKVFNTIHASNREPVKSPTEVVLKTGEIIDLQNHTLLIAKDATEHHISQSVAPIKNKGGDTIGIILVFSDITEKQILQERLYQNEKVEAMGQLASGIVHDFNNMLCGIMGAAELITEYIPAEDHEAVSYHSMIIDSAQRASDLTRRLLIFGDKQKRSFSLVNINKAICEAAGLLQMTIDKRITLEVSLVQQSNMVVGDLSQLDNAILNLGINASHAMPDGGSLCITSANIDLDSHYCQSSEFDISPGKYISIEVRDSGTGIPAEVLDKIFDPFFTTKEEGKGTGLGLSSVIESVKQHSGAITVSSEIGQGTSFTIFIPVANSETEETSLLPQITHGNGRILVVDDEAIMRETAQAILNNLGYEIVLAEDGLEAVTILQQSPDSFDLVILDMMMPEMNGRDCFFALHNINPQQKIIISSGFTRDKDLEEMRVVGLCDFIRKPFRLYDLSNAVHKAIETETTTG